MYLVERIIEKCENSQNDWRLGATGGKSFRVYQPGYDAFGAEGLGSGAGGLGGAGVDRV